MSERYELGDVEAFTPGAVGRPGERTFLVQARSGATFFTVKCEKQQVLALGEYFQRLLTDLAPPDGQPAVVIGPLAEPLVPLWVLGAIAVAYDADDERFVVVLEEVVPEDDEGNPDPEAEADKGVLELRLTRAQAAAFAERAEELGAAGRPTCRFCGRPMDLEGHACPRMN